MASGQTNVGVLFGVSLSLPQSSVGRLDEDTTLRYRGKLVADFPRNV